MINHILILIIYTMVCIFFGEMVFKEKNKKFIFPAKVFVGVIAVAVFLRLILSALPYYFSFDISCFKAWSDYTTFYGFNNLYGQDFFLDYPPGYMYVLFVLRNIANVFNIPLDSGVYTMLIKLPAIFADMGCGFLVYKVAKENWSENVARFLTSAFLLCPVIIYNSSVWGQIESFYVFFVALSIYFAYKNKTALAAVSYAYAFLVKPQAIFFGLILLFYIIEKKSVKEFFKAAIVGLGSIYIMVLPFCQNIFDLSWLVTLYKNTFGGLQYFTVNAYNLYTTLGLNWVGLDRYKGSELINVVVILLMSAFVGVVFLKLKNRAKFFYLSGFIMVCTFCFTTMMHERYVYPAVLFAILALALSKQKSVFYLFLAVGGINYLNCVAILKFYMDNYTMPVFLTIILAIGMLFCFGVSVWILIKWLKEDKALAFTTKEKQIAAVAALTVIYGVFALFSLGSGSAPESYFLSQADNMEFEIEFAESETIKSVYTFGGIGDDSVGERVKKESSNFDIYYTDDNGAENLLVTIKDKSVFQWSVEACDVVAQKVRVVAQTPNEVLNEIIFVNEKGQAIEVQASNYNPDASYPATNAVDEADKLPDDISYYNSAYFDEIYHARTAYEQIHGYSIYETTHPPLGKILISIGIQIFGMNPFGWRIIGTLCGIAMLPIFYLLAKGLFKSFFAAFSATALLALDFMHLTQTRISTVDTYVVLFTMLTFLFMLYYHKTKFTESLNKQFLYLLLSGFFMGCTIAVKWNGAYAMAGLAVFFFVSLYLKYQGSEKDKKAKKRVVNTILFCCLAFGLVPVILYALTFIPVINASSIWDYISQAATYQVNMFNYHSNLDAEHFFSSLWYTWPFTIKPIWYSVTMLAGEMVSTISAFGNPLIWWLTPIAVGISVKFATKEKDSTIWLVILGFIFSLLPWVFVTRLSFIYHYFPSAIFGILAIGFVIDNLIIKHPKSKKYVVAYLVLCAVFFLIFLPVTTGVPVAKEYIEALEWLPTWHFVN